MIYWQPGGITFPPTLLPPSRGIACVVSCGMRERTSEAERQRGKDEGEKENCRFILERGKKRKKDFPSLEKKIVNFFFSLPSSIHGIHGACINGGKMGKERNRERKSGTTGFAFVPTIIVLMNYSRPLSRLILPSKFPS